MTKELHALVIDAKGNAELKYVRGDLASIKEIVGGWIEPFGPVDQTYGNWHGYCDEEGKIKGLSFNLNATAVADALGWDKNPGDVLCGPVIFLGVDPSNPHEEADFPPEATGKVVRLFAEHQN